MQPTPTPVHLVRLSDTVFSEVIVSEPFDSFWMWVGREVRASKLPTQVQTLITFIIKKIFDSSVQTPYEIEENQLKQAIKNDFVFSSYRETLNAYLPKELTLITEKYVPPNTRSHTVNVQLAKCYLSTYLEYFCSDGSTLNYRYSVPASYKPLSKSATALILSRKVQDLNRGSIPADGVMSKEEILSILTKIELTFVDIAAIVDMIECWMSLEPTFKRNLDAEITTKYRMDRKFKLLHFVLENFPNIHTINIGWCTKHYLSTFLEQLDEYYQQIQEIQIDVEDTTNKSELSSLYENINRFPHLHTIKLSSCPLSIAQEVQQEFDQKGKKIAVIVINSSIFLNKGVEVSFEAVQKSYPKARNGDWIVADEQIFASKVIAIYKPTKTTQVYSRYFVGFSSDKTNLFYVNGERPGVVKAKDTFGIATLDAHLMELLFSGGSK